MGIIAHSYDVGRSGFRTRASQFQAIRQTRPDGIMTPFATLLGQARNLMLLGQARYLMLLGQARYLTLLEQARNLTCN